MNYITKRGTRRCTSNDAKKQFAGVYLSPSATKDFTRISGQSVCYRENEGKLIALFLADVFNKEEQQTRLDVWKQITVIEPRNRAEIFGRGSRMPLETQKGHLTDFIGVPKTLIGSARSGLIGFGRKRGKDSGKVICSATGMTNRKPGLFAAAHRQALSIANLYKQELPSEYANQMGYVDTILPEYKILGTPFTAMYGLTQKPTACHRDDFNVPEGTGVLTTAGAFRGGEFCLPEFGLAFNVQPSDILFVDVVNLWHGNKPAWCGDQRYSQIYFARVGMHECGKQYGASMISAADIAADGLEDADQVAS